MEGGFESTQIYLVIENIPFSIKIPLILPMSAFSLAKKIAFFLKNSTQSNSMGAVLDFFGTVFSFCKTKSYS